MMETNKEYWDRYYSAEIKDLTGPSQFACFVLNEFPALRQIIDIGCGNGRDSAFFATYGKNVIGLDNSEKVILGNKDKYNRQRNLDFKVFDIRHDSLEISLDRSVIIYSRFFLHAINKSSEDKFIEICESISQKTNVFVCVEYRTTKDKNLEKSTQKHYRRFINPSKLNSAFETSGFTEVYHREGLGYAKYKNDDAYVARTIFTSDEKK